MPKKKTLTRLKRERCRRKKGQCKCKAVCAECKRKTARVKSEFCFVCSHRHSSFCSFFFFKIYFKCVSLITISLFRICKPKKHPSSFSRIKVLLFNQSFISLYHPPLLSHHCRFVTPADDVPNPTPSFSTFIHSFKNFFLTTTSQIYCHPLCQTRFFFSI